VDNFIIADEDPRQRNRRFCNWDVHVVHLMIPTFLLQQFCSCADSGGGRSHKRRAVETGIIWPIDL